jgi:hypothetical protein
MYRLILPIAVMVLALITPAPADAGEVEADVIWGAYDNATILTADGELDPDGISAFTADAMDIWLDTRADSHCETYAAAVYGIAFMASAFSFDIAENDVPTLTMPLPAVMTLIEDQLAVLDRNCRNEM